MLLEVKRRFLDVPHLRRLIHFLGIAIAIDFLYAPCGQIVPRPMRPLVLRLLVSFLLGFHSSGGLLHTRNANIKLFLRLKRIKLVSQLLTFFFTLHIVVQQMIITNLLVHWRCPILVQDQ